MLPKQFEKHFKSIIIDAGVDVDYAEIINNKLIEYKNYIEMASVSFKLFEEN